MHAHDLNLVNQPIIGLFCSSFYVAFSNCVILPVSNVPVFLVASRRTVRIELFLCPIESPTILLSFYGPLAKDFVTSLSAMSAEIT